MTLSRDESTGTTLEQPDPPTISFIFALVGDIEFVSDPAIATQDFSRLHEVEIPIGSNNKCPRLS